MKHLILIITAVGIPFFTYAQDSDAICKQLTSFYARVNELWCNVYMEDTILNTTSLGVEDNLEVQNILRNFGSPQLVTLDFDKSCLRIPKEKVIRAGTEFESPEISYSLEDLSYSQSIDSISTLISNHMVDSHRVVVDSLIAIEQASIESTQAQVLLKRKNQNSFKSVLIHAVYENPTMLIVFYSLKFYAKEAIFKYELILK